MISKLPSFLWLDAKDVVADTLEAMSKDKVKTVVVPGKQYKLIVFVYRYLPWLASILARRTIKQYRVTE